MISPHDTFPLKLDEFGVAGGVAEFRAGTARFWMEYQKTLRGLSMSDDDFLERCDALVSPALVGWTNASGAGQVGSLVDELTPQAFYILTRMLPTYATIGAEDKKKSDSQSRSNTGSSACGPAPMSGTP